VEAAHCPTRLSLRDLQSFGANFAKFVTLAGFDPTSGEVKPWRCFLHARNNRLPSRASNLLKSVERLGDNS
jgi:hypothetical protein